LSVGINLPTHWANRRDGGFPAGRLGSLVPGDATRWALVNAKKKLQAAEEEVARLKERVKELEGQVLDLGGDPGPDSGAP
jgi:hypothetical protein